MIDSMIILAKQHPILTMMIVYGLMVLTFFYVIGNIPKFMNYLDDNFNMLGSSILCIFAILITLVFVFIIIFTIFK